MAKKEKWYAVRKGRNPGIYQTWKECQQQVIGFPCAEFKSFEDRACAEQFMNGASVPSGKFYAVRHGWKPGLYDSWEACQEAILEFPHPVYKSFLNRDEATAWLNGENYWEQMIRKDREQGILTAYCDGSFDGKHKRYGWGVAIVEADRVVELSGSDTVEEYLESRNVAGEVMGALTAMEYAKAHGWKGVHIYHDYTGLAFWARKEWKANKPLSRMYVERYEQEYAGCLSVEFTKVAAHTGVEYNELADKLAFSAAFGSERA